MKEVGRQASVNTKFHVLYGYYFLGLNKTKLSEIYKKTKPTIANWITSYESEGSVGRKANVNKVYKKFGYEKRKFLLELYNSEPVLYLEEAKEIFAKQFDMSISVTSIHTILHEGGLTWKVLERRAIQIQLKDIMRFCDELAELKWGWEQLVFLDEVSFDGRDMIRKKGYRTKGERLLYRGEFGRSARSSCLCFLGSEGVINLYETEGTFDRQKFVEYCRRFALDNQSKITQYPGRHSVWILDGARIHCHDNFIYYLRYLGIVPVFLPSYCPMFNPIEFVFGMVKRNLKKLNTNEKKMDGGILLCKAFKNFVTYDMTKLFKNCGYLASGQFDPSNGLGEDLTKYGFGQ